MRSDKLDAFAFLPRRTLPSSCSFRFDRINKRDALERGEQKKSSRLFPFHSLLGFPALFYGGVMQLAGALLFLSVTMTGVH